MPMRDENGNELSGGTKRKLRKLEAARSLEREAESGRVITPSLEPPPAETSELITWTAAAMGQVFLQAYHDATLRGPERYRILGALGGTVGMLRDKAREQGRIKKLAQAHGLEEKETPTGMEPIARTKTIRPPTARRVRAAGDSQTR